MIIFTLGKICFLWFLMKLGAIVTIILRFVVELVVAHLETEVVLRIVVLMIH